MRKSVPLIGMTCRGLGNLPAHPDLYRRAVERAGGSSIFIPPGTDVKDISLSCDGFIIPGGRDPAPASYNEGSLFSLETEDPQRTGFELMLLHEIIRLRKPVLGICYGMQLINIFFGGSLYQDIRGQIPGSLEHERKMHPVIISGNPFMKSGEFPVNSRHHQAVKETGRGVVVFAYARDGITEAFYLEEYRFLVGVQWHPERNGSALSSALFGKFIEACRDHQ
ncbi:MAG: type 1 glutamine amidotransferase [Candidatus Sulfobium sp.]